MKVLWIAGNTFRENIRDKVLYNLVTVAFLLVGGALLLGELSIGYEMKIIIDIGMASVSLTGVLIAVFIGISLVQKEIEKRTIYNIVSKPVSRHQFLLGKFLGLLFTLAVNVSLMVMAIFAALIYLNGRWDWSFLNILPATLLIFMELVLVTALSLFFSSFSTPVLSAVFTLSLWVAGHFNNDFLSFAKLSKSPVAEFTCRLLYYLLPNFSNFDSNAAPTAIQQAGYLQTPEPVVLLAAFAYGSLYTVLLLAAAAGIFERRDFK